MTEGLKATSQLIVAIDSAIDQQTRTRHEDFHVPVARREEDKDEESLLSKCLLILHSVRTLSREREREKAAMTPKFVRVPSIRERVEDTLSAHRNELVALLSRFPPSSSSLFVSYPCPYSFSFATNQSS